MFITVTIILTYNEKVKKNYTLMFTLVAFMILRKICFLDRFIELEEMVGLITTISRGQISLPGRMTIIHYSNLPDRISVQD